VVNPRRPASSLITEPALGYTVLFKGMLRVSRILDDSVAAAECACDINALRKRFEEQQQPAPVEK